MDTSSSNRPLTILPFTLPVPSTVAAPKPRSTEVSSSRLSLRNPPQEEPPTQTSQPTNTSPRTPKAPHANCDSCPLYEFPAAFGDGPSQADICIVGEAPGSDEVKQGKVFTGPSGKLLNSILAQHDIRREDVYVTNAVICRPPIKDYKQQPPPTAAIKACRTRLVEELRSRDPTTIIATGAVAAKSILGNASGITELRMQHDTESPDFPGVRVVPTFHPAAALRDPNKYPSIVADIGRIKENVTIGWEPTKYKVARNTDDGLRYLAAQVQANKLLVADIERDYDKTDPEDRTQSKFLCIGISHRPGASIVYTKEVVDDPRFQIELRKALRGDYNNEWGYQFGKFDIQYEWFFAPEARVGQDSLLLHYCHVRGTKIAMRDLTWQNIENLHVGDELIGFTGKSQRPNQPSGNLSPTRVLGIQNALAECYEVVTPRKSLVVTKEHLWPVNRAGSNTLRWLRMDEIAERMVTSRAQYRLPFFVEPWDVDNSYEAGYIAGILDGEGCLQRASRWGVHDSYHLTFSQKGGLVLDQAISYLEDKGFKFTVDRVRDTGVYVCHFSGRQSSLRALGMFRPARFMQNTDRYWIGPRKHIPTPILAVNKVGIRDVVAIQTDLLTFIADGFLSHNSTDERTPQGGGGHDLELIATTKLKAPRYKTDTRAYLPYKGASLALLPPEVLYQYNAADADVTHRLIPLLTKEAKEDGTYEMYQTLLIPGANALAKVESTGVHVDLDYLNRLAVEFASSLEARELELARWVENPRSHVQVKRALELLGYDVPNTRKDTIKDIPEEFVTQELAYKSEHKLLSTYVTGLRRRAISDRIYTNFNLHTTETGRLSSSNPNLQNIPKGSKIRDAFIADEGYTLVSADYKGIELRVMACLANDPYLIQAFREGRDINEEFALRLFGPSYSVKEYVTTKSVIYGSIYMESAGHLAPRLGTTDKEARRIQGELFRRSPRLKEFWKEVQDQVFDNGYVRSMFGRVRRFWLVTYENRKDVIKQAVNFPVSSPASDLTLRALIRLSSHPLVLDGTIKPIITVHDQLVFNVLTQHLLPAIRVIRDVMEDNPEFPVPTVVDVAVGQRWGSAVEHKRKHENCAICEVLRS